SRSVTKVASFDDGAHVGRVCSLGFSENGYYLATAADGHGLVRLWDLRKLSNFHTISALETDGARAVVKTAFDPSAQFLAVASSKEIRIFLNKQWDELARFAPHTADITGFNFGVDSKRLFSCGMDRKISIFGV
ncbi:E3 ubiquitin-protein ligase prp19, partial [Cladochytrium tenue]